VDEGKGPHCNPRGRVLHTLRNRRGRRPACVAAAATPRSPPGCAGDRPPLAGAIRLQHL